MMADAVFVPTLKVSDKALATMQQKRLAEMDITIGELVSHIKAMDKRIALLEKGAK